MKSQFVLVVLAVMAVKVVLMDLIGTAVRKELLATFDWLH